MATTAADWTYVKFLTAITSGGDIPIDINAATIANLEVDIAASSIGNIPIDIIAQTLGDINIDLNAQTIGRIVIRDHDGGIESASNAQVQIGHGERESLHSYSGSGSLRYVFFRSIADTDSHLMTPEIYIDAMEEPLMPNYNFYQYNMFGFKETTRPHQLLNYSVDGDCGLMFYFEKGLIFDTKIEFKAYNDSADQDNSINCDWFYQKLS